MGQHTFFKEKSWQKFLMAMIRTRAISKFESGSEFRQKYPDPQHCRIGINTKNN
jgi:hypothetical protein